LELRPHTSTSMSHSVWTGTFGSAPTYLGGFNQIVPGHGNRLTRAKR
jgi:hypothetical protein